MTCKLHQLRTFKSHIKNILVTHTNQNNNNYKYEYTSCIHFSSPETIFRLFSSINKTILHNKLSSAVNIQLCHIKNILVTYNNIYNNTI